MNRFLPFNECQNRVITTGVERRVHKTRGLDKRGMGREVKDDFSFSSLRNYGWKRVLLVDMEGGRVVFVPFGYNLFEMPAEEPNRQMEMWA